MNYRDELDLKRVIYELYRREISKEGIKQLTSDIIQAVHDVEDKRLSETANFERALKQGYGYVQCD